MCYDTAKNRKSKHGERDGAMTNGNAANDLLRSFLTHYSRLKQIIFGYLLLLLIRFILNSDII